MLMVGKSQLTAKQRKFAEAVAMGETGAQAYRMAYDTKAKPKTQGTEASMLKANPLISREIEALKLAIEAQKYRSAESLRALVIQSLTQTIIDPDVKPAVRVQAAKVLGTVTEVAAFTERKEITTITDSAQIRERILGELKTIAMSSADVQDVDATDLLAELVGGGASSAQDGDPTVGAPQAEAERDSDSRVHTIPHPRSPEISEPTPLSGETSTPGGDIFLENGDAAPQ